MKFINIILLIVVLSFTALAQLYDDAKVGLGDGIKTVSITGFLVEADTLYTSEFKLADCEAIFYVYRHYNSATSKPRVKILRQERIWADAWATTDTYSTADSLETYQAARTDTVTATYPVAVRFVLIGTATNPTDTWFDIKVRAKLN